MSETDSGSQSNKKMEPSTTGVLFGFVLGAPVGILSLFLSPSEEIAGFITFSTITVAFWYGFFQNWDSEYNIVEEITLAHVAGLFVGVPTWAEIGLLYLLFF
jgi:hypothetical protein